MLAIVLPLIFFWVGKFTREDLDIISAARRLFQRQLRWPERQSCLLSATSFALLLFLVAVVNQRMREVDR
jgi:hypothetical protein